MDIFPWFTHVFVLGLQYCHFVIHGIHRLLKLHTLTAIKIIYKNYNLPLWLTHWTLGYILVIWRVQYPWNPNHMLEALIVKLLSGGCHKTNLMVSQHCSGSGLVPSGKKPWPELMLIQIYVANLPYGVTRPIGYNELMHHPESSYTRMSLLEVPYVIEAPHPQKKRSH